MKHRCSLLALLGLSALGLLGCARAAAPSVLSDVERAQQTPAAEQAEKLAPQAFAHAQGLAHAASDASDDGHTIAAEILGHHALVAFEHAFVLARLAQAETRRQAAEQEAATIKTALTKLEGEQQRLAAEARDLEMRARVARDAVPLLPNVKADPKREAARREAAKALAMQARLLCVATRMLDPKAPGVEAALKALDALPLAPTDTAPIDEARRLRSRCLNALSTKRQKGARSAPHQSLGDRLLDELSRAGLEPHRDDRGVVVTLRGLFNGSDLTDDAKRQLSELAQVAKANSDFPLLLVIHSHRKASSSLAQARARSVNAQLQELGVQNAQAQVAGAVLPLVPSGRRGAARSNERLELVFVSPSP